MKRIQLLPRLRISLLKSEALAAATVESSRCGGDILTALPVHVYLLGPGPPSSASLRIIYRLDVTLVTVSGESCRSESQCSHGRQGA